MRGTFFKGETAPPAEEAQDSPSGGVRSKLRRTGRKRTQQGVPKGDETPVRVRDNRLPREKDDPGLYRVVAVGGVELERRSASSILNNLHPDTLARDTLIHIGEVTVNSETRRVSGHVTSIVGVQEEVSGWIPLLDLDTGFSWANKVSIKEQVKMTLQKPVYDVRNFYWTMGIWQTIARSPVFENITLCVISINAIWIAIDTDNNKAPNLVQSDPIFQIAEHTFCVYFSFEWTVRFCAFKYKRNCLRDLWFLFDTVLVCLMVIETWVMTIVTFAVGASHSTGGQASLLRLLRLLRLSRLARMLRSMPELLILIKGIAAATRSVFFTVLLLVIIMYVVSIIFRQLTDGTDIGDLYFPSVLMGMKTLTTTGGFLDNYNETVDALGELSSWYILAFITFTLLAACTVLNMLIGILCEVVQDVAVKEKEGMLMEFVRGRMEEIMNSLDDDGSGSISKEEFRKIMHKPEAVRILQETGVDAENLVDYIDYIFESEDGDDVELNLERFLDLILKFRSSNTATVKDAVDMRTYVKSAFKRLENRLQNKKQQASQPNNKKLKDKSKGMRGDVVPKHGGALVLPERLPKGAVDCLDRMDAMLAALSNEMERLKLETARQYLPSLAPSMVNPLRHQDEMIFSSASSESEVAGQAERLKSTFRRVERFASMGLDELQKLDSLLPVTAGTAESTGISRRARVWRANTEEFYLTVCFDALEKISQVLEVTPEGPALQDTLNLFSETLESRLTALRDLFDTSTALPAAGCPADFGATGGGGFHGSTASGAPAGGTPAHGHGGDSAPPGNANAGAGPAVLPAGNQPGTPGGGLNPASLSRAGTPASPTSPAGVGRAGTPSGRTSGSAKVVPFEPSLPGAATSPGGSMVSVRAAPKTADADAAAGGMVA